MQNKTQYSRVQIQIFSIYRSNLHLSIIIKKIKSVNMIITQVFVQTQLLKFYLFAKHTIPKLTLLKN